MLNSIRARAPSRRVLAISRKYRFAGGGVNDDFGVVGWGRDKVAKGDVGVRKGELSAGCAVGGETRADGEFEAEGETGSARGLCACGDRSSVDGLRRVRTRGEDTTCERGVVG